MSASLPLSQKVDFYQQIREMSFSDRMREMIYAPYAKSLLHELDHSSSDVFFQIFAKCMAYLSVSSHSELKLKLTQKLEALDSDAAKAQLIKIVSLSTQPGQGRLLVTCQKIISLELLKKLFPVNVPDEVKQDQLVAPKSSSGLKQLSQGMFRYIYLHSGYVGKITQRFFDIIFLSYKIDLDKRIKEQWQAQTQLTTLRNLVTDVCVVGALVAAYFPSYLAITAVACAVLVTLAALAYVYMRYNLGTPETLSSLYGSNLNLEAKKWGEGQRTMGRVDEMHVLEEQLSSTTGRERYVPIILGPPGSGKTQLMEGMALKIVEGRVNKSLLGKQILLVNSQTLSGGVRYDQDEGTTNRLEMLFQALKGFENKFILFFDEAHNLGAKGGDSVFEGAGNNHLEDLKTKVLTSGIQCVFATTTEEYETSIALNKALVSRLKPPIILESLEAKDVICLLKTKHKDSEVTIKSDVYGAIAAIAQRLSKIEAITQLIEPVIKPLGKLSLSCGFYKKLAKYPDQIQTLLQEYFPQVDQAEIEVLVNKERSIFRKARDISVSEGGFNPRLADQVLEQAVSHIKAYKPKNLEKALNEVSLSYLAQVRLMQEQMQDDYRAYRASYSAEVAKLEELKSIQDRLKALFEKQSQLVKSLEEITEQLLNANKRWHELIHLIVENVDQKKDTSTFEKEYLFIRGVLIPGLDQQKRSVLASFSADFDEYNEPVFERIVTVEVLEKLNPE